MSHKLFEQAGFTRREAIALGVAAIAGAAIGSPIADAKTKGIPHGAIIRTLLRDIPPDSFKGPILFHEHLSLRYPLNAQHHFTDDVDMMTDEVRAAGKDGIACIVDAGHPDMHRNLDALKRIATESGMPIVASCGYYMQRSYPPELANQSADEIAEHLVDEAKTQHLGAIGEIGQQGGVLTDEEKKVFQAAAKAQAKTGLPLFTHNAYTGDRPANPPIPKDSALRQLDVLEAAGADVNHVAIGHVCCLDDPDVTIAKQLAKRGAFVGFDRVTIKYFISDEKRAAMIMKMVDAGYADKILISSDFSSGRALKSRGGPGLAEAWTVFAPMLLKAGLPKHTLRSIMIDNPKRFLAFVPR